LTVDGEKVRKLEQLIASELPFDAVVPVSGQTYSRRLDSLVVERAVWHCPERQQIFL